MPEMDGFQLGEWWHENKPEERHRLILMTGSIGKDVEEFCAEHGYGLVHKPFEENELIEAMGKALNSSRQKAAQI
jgi:CheY-like chemotaxis protein